MSVSVLSNVCKIHLFFLLEGGAGNLEIETSHFRLLLVNVMGRDDGEKGGLKDEYQRDESSNAP